MASTGVQTARQKLPALCVDLDETLIRGDLLWECVLLVLKTRPATLFWVPFWLLSGRGNLKHQLAKRVSLNPARLSYREEVINLVRQERAAGRTTALVTAADASLAESVSEYLGLFDEVHATQGSLNLKGARKAEFLANHFGERGFEYVGDSAADVAVWRSAQAGYVVGSERRVHEAAAATSVKGVFLTPRTSFSTWINAIRGHHWAKNLLLFLPLALSHNLSFAPLLDTFLGFVLYGLCASGLYILNDLLDLHSDREHPWKKARPFAAGEISIPQGLAASGILLSLAIGLAFTLAFSFGLALVAYAAVTMLYSFVLKKIALLDVFVLCSFYSFRIVAGALISATPLSQWFLAFSLFFFLSLAMAKRYSELVHAGELLKSGNSGRGYRTEDRDLLLALGVSSSFAAVIILSLYVHSQEVLALYSSPQYLFLICPIMLYWLSRNWLLAHRGELKEDPVTLSIRDRASYAVALASAAVIAASLIKTKF